jgi:hypothetical protein
MYSVLTWGSLNPPPVYISVPSLSLLTCGIDGSWIKDTIPTEVVGQLGHSEDNLAPFDQELYDQLDRLSKALKH